MPIGGRLGAALYPLELAGSSAHAITLAASPSLSNRDYLVTVQWILSDSPASGTQRVWQHGYDGAHGFAQYLAFNVSGGSSAARIDCSRARSGGGQQAIASQANFTVPMLGRYVCIITTADPVTAANNRIYLGDHYQPPREPSSYVTQAAGAGTFNDNSAVPVIYGNRDAAFTQSLDGRLVYAARYVGADMPTADELLAMLRMERWHGARCVGEWWFGGPSARQIDWSGEGNHATVSSGIKTGAPFPLIGLLNPGLEPIVVRAPAVTRVPPPLHIRQAVTRAAFH